LHHLSEGVVIALLAGSLAVTLAVVALRVLATIAPAGLPRLSEVGFGWQDGALVVAVAIVVGIILALIPLAHMRVDQSALREGSRGLTLSRRRVAVRGALVVGQVALAMVLLAGAGLLLRSFQKLRAVSLGFDPAGVTTMVVALPAARYREYERASAYWEQLALRLAAVPGVEKVGFSGGIPLTGKQGCTGVNTDRPSPTGRREACITNLQAAPGYFAAMKIRVRGHEPDWTEVHQRAGGAVVTRALAEVLWPGEDPIGKGIRCCRPGPPYYTVVGVADDVHDDGLDAPPLQAVYFPLVPIEGAPIEDLPLYMHLVVRAANIAPASLTTIVQRLAGELDPQVPVDNARSMDDVVARSMAKRTFTLMLLGVAASMALLLSAVGLYGVISYVVGNRRGEIGIRMALGASASRVARMVVLQSLTLVALGVGLGLVGAIAGTRVLQSLLFGVTPTDPMVLGAVTVLLLLLAVGASFAPTRRAVQVDPAEVMRAE
jgi:predicted permease